MSLVLKSFIKNRLAKKSSDLRFVLFKGQASRLYSRMGRHLVLINSKTTSSDVVLPIFPKIPFTARQNELLAWEHLKIWDWTINRPRYLISSTQGIRWPPDVYKLLQGLSQRGLTLGQHDFFELIAMSRWVNSNSQAANNLSNRVTVGASSKISSAYNIRPT